MRSELLRMAADLSNREEPFVLAVVVRRRPASSSQPGNMAVITAAGDFHGWLGGSCTQPTVAREARLALADGQPRLLILTPDPESEQRPGVDVFPMTCQSGGSVEIYLEPMLPAPRLVVFGSSPIARALAHLGGAMGYSVAAVEDDLEALAKNAAPAPSPRFTVIATMGEQDEEAIRTALAQEPAYLGVVASSRRFAQMRETLLAQGVAEEKLDRIHSPAGIAIGAKTPEEIALSILAQIVSERRAMAEEKPAAIAEPAAEPLAAQALDPICGMTVEVATARHTAEHAGRMYYFCCGGCRQRFLAEPERYIQAGAA
ncbi:MAG TPA: XdhC family protein [Thermoanaerobaculia bacterium]|nr:XdhC family protein [Thermoanaerobaculia bacterium]